MEGFSKPLRELTQMPSLLSPFKSRAWIRVEKKEAVRRGHRDRAVGMGRTRAEAQRRRGGTGRRGNAGPSNQLFATALDSRQQITPKTPSEKVGIRAWTLPTPMARSKTPPRPLREALRMGRTRAEAQRGDGDRVGMRAFSDGISHRGHRVHREILPFTIDGGTAASAGLRSDGKGGQVG